MQLIIKRLLLLVFIALNLSSSLVSAQGKLSAEPPHWWVGMAHEQVELLVYSNDVPYPLGEFNVSLSADRVRIENVITLDNPHYIILNLFIFPDASSQSIEITFSHASGEILSMPYTLSARAPGSADRAGFTAKDVIYLIAPDRFANGDTTNDNNETMLEKVDRNYKGGRHGGDIQGMINHLDYISQMGFTQVWTMPLLENDMQKYSYHGYSTTDFFKIDPRFGSNALYREFVEIAQSKGIGVIKDVILNHMGSNHPWMKDMPSSDWINHGTTFKGTTHTRESLHDPHSVQADIDEFAKGWFVPTMPDMNQQHPHLAQYLIQYAIWWIEYAGLSGLRVDTYSYSDKQFLSHWTQALIREYPNLTIVGEEWSVNPAITAYWQADSPRYDDYVSSLPSVMDFPLQVALSQALLEEDTWATGIRKIYDTLASDFLYGDPYKLVVFGDNHDMNRIMPQMNNDESLFMMAMKFLLTTRGIPQIFYGTEIGMSDQGDGDHGILRADFPGGWPGDVVNGFTGAGLSEREKRIQKQLKFLLNWRKNTPAITDGKLTHYFPKDGIYVYFRHHEQQRIMVVLNKNKSKQSLDLARFKEMLPLEQPGIELVNIENNSRFTISQDLSIPAQSVMIFEVK